MYVVVLAAAINTITVNTLQNFLPFAPFNRDDSKPSTFPFHKFWNETSTKATGKFTNAMYSCEEHDDGGNKCCDCSERCMDYGNCCIDKFWTPKLNPETDFDGYMSQFKKRFQRSRLDVGLECTEVVILLPDGYYDRQSWLMKASCPRGTHAKVAEKCSSINSVAEPLVRGDDKILYKNMHCAQCHQISEFTKINLTINCNSRQNDSQKGTVVVELLEKCKLSWMLAGSNTQTCFSNSKCPKDSRVGRLCEMYKAPIGEYKNYHCRQCQLGPGLPMETVEKRECQKNIYVPRTRWSFMIQLFNSEIGTEAEIYEVKKSSKQVSGKHNNTTQLSHVVRDLLLNDPCPPGYGPRELDCVKLDSAFHRASSISVHPCFYARSPKIFLYPHDSSNSSVIRTTLQNIINISSTLLFDDAKSETLELTGNGSRILSELLHRSFSLLDPLMELIDRIVLIDNSAFISSLDLSDWYKQKFFSDESLCAETFPIDTEHTKITNSCTAVIGNATIPFSDISYVIVVDKRTTSLNIKGCKRFFAKPSCIAKDILPVSQKRRALDLGYIFCTPFKMKLLNEVGGYISFGGSLLSIVCSIISLTTFHLFPQTLPFGLICLCACFLMSDTLYVVASALNATDTLLSFELCKGLAIALHLCTIELQCCSVISALDIAMKFGVFSPNNKRRISFEKYIFKRIPFMVTVPTLLVSLALLFDYLDIVDMSYGKKGMCFINGFYGRLWFYVTPNGISVICTSVLVIFTLRTIGKQNRQGERSFKKGVSTRPALSVTRITSKLVLAYGMSELVGFVQLPWTGETIGLINNTMS